MSLSIIKIFFTKYLNLVVKFLGLSWGIQISISDANEKLFSKSVDCPNVLKATSL